MPSPQFMIGAESGTGTVITLQNLKFLSAGPGMKVETAIMIAEIERKDIGLPSLRGHAEIACIAFFQYIFNILAAEICFWSHGTFF